MSIVEPPITRSLMVNWPMDGVRVAVSADVEMDAIWALIVGADDRVSRSLLATASISSPVTVVSIDPRTIFKQVVSVHEICPLSIMVLESIEMPVWPVTVAISLELSSSMFMKAVIPAIALAGTIRSATAKITSFFITCLLFDDVSLFRRRVSPWSSAVMTLKTPAQAHGGSKATRLSNY